MDLYEHIREEPDYIEIAYSIWCDKIGSKCGWYGYCEDAFTDDIKPLNKSNKKRLNKHSRRYKYQQHLKKLNRIAYYPTPVMYIEENWDKKLRKYIPLDKPYYKRCYRGNHDGSRYKFYKRYANKNVRRYQGELHNGGSYKKVYDYWWSVD